VLSHTWYSTCLWSDPPCLCHWQNLGCWIGGVALGKEWSGMLLWVWTLGLTFGSFTLRPAKGSKYSYILVAMYFQPISLDSQRSLGTQSHGLSTSTAIVWSFPYICTGCSVLAMVQHNMCGTHSLSHSFRVHSELKLSLHIFSMQFQYKICILEGGDTHTHTMIVSFGRRMVKKSFSSTQASGVQREVRKVLCI
jgi:hypothetical protein